MSKRSDQMGRHIASELRRAFDEEEARKRQFEADAALGRIVRESGLTADDAEAVWTIYGWAGNGASRIVDCMRALAEELRKGAGAIDVIAMKRARNCVYWDRSVRGERARLRAALGEANAAKERAERERDEAQAMLCSRNQAAAVIAKVREERDAAIARAEAAESKVLSPETVGVIEEAMALYRDHVSMWEGRRDYLIDEANAADAEFTAKYPKEADRG